MYWLRKLVVIYFHLLWCSFQTSKSEKKERIVRVLQMCRSVISLFYIVQFSSLEHNYSEHKLLWEHRKLLKMGFCSAHITPMKLWLICFLNDSSFILFYSLLNFFIHFYIPTPVPASSPPPDLCHTPHMSLNPSPIHFSERLPWRSQQSLACKLNQDQVPLCCIKVEQGIHHD